MICIRLCAPNDRSGNPRRVFVVLDEDIGIVAAIDEGYRSFGAISQAGFPASLAASCLSFDTTASEYESLLRRDAAWRVVRS